MSAIRWRTLAAAALLVGAAPLGAQGTSPLARERDIRGSVRVSRATGEQPVVGTWVTLHRVADDSSGPLDSVRSDGRGTYAFRFRPFGAADAIYFASVRYGDVAYFTPPLSEGTGADAGRIDVFDTTTRAVPMSLRGRHVIVAEPDARGMRQIVEVYEVSNDSSLTMIEATGATGGTWSAPMPRGAEKASVRSGEVPPDAMQFAPGRAVLHMPFAPGLKQIAFGYELPASAFPIAITAPKPTSVLEVLIEDQRGTVSGAKVVAVAPVTAEGRPFRRYLAQDVPANAAVTIDVPAPAPTWSRWIVPGVLVVTGLGMLGALLWSRQRQAARASRTSPDRVMLAEAMGPAALPWLPTAELDTDAVSIAREIAALDDEFANSGSRETSAGEYERRRSALKARLATAMREGAPTG